MKIEIFSEAYDEKYRLQLNCKQFGSQMLLMSSHASFLFEKDGGETEFCLLSSFEWKIEGAEDYHWLSFSCFKGQDGAYEIALKTTPNPISDRARFANCCICAGGYRIPLIITQAADDRAVMLRLRDSLMTIKENHDAVQNYLGWTGKNVENWHRVSLPWGVDHTKTVIGLDLGQAKLSGPFPKEMLHLVHLTSLHLCGNHFYGRLPSEIGHMTQMRYLYLDRNQFTGNIPKELGYLSQLYYLSIGHAQFTGAIPKEIGYLSQLEVLHLNHNQLSGSIPAELGALSQLTSLDLSNNQLSGSIPKRFAALKKMKIFQVSENHLSGRIPSSVIRSMGALGEPWPQFPAAYRHLPYAINPQYSPADKEKAGETTNALNW